MATNKEWALKMIPILVRWAQGAWDKPHYYSDLTAAVGHKTNQIGNVMGTIQDIIDDLQKKSGKKIPTLNCLVFSKSSDLPSDGFDYVIKNYSKLSPDSKKGEVRKRRTRQTLWRAVQMLTQKLCCQTIHDCPKVVPLHYESE